MLGPLLIGERVTLSPITPEMLPVFVGWFADPDVTCYLSFRYPPTIDEEREWFRKHSEARDEVIWAVLAGNENAPRAPHTRLIGTTAIGGIDWPNRRANTGNLIGEKNEWGKGYGSEAVQLRTRWAFEEMGLQKLSTQVFMENIGSRKVLEKAGYKQYGTARRHEWRRGKWHDMWLADILAEEWFRANAPIGETVGTTSDD